jgi:hypothetical protein
MKFEATTMHDEWVVREAEVHRQDGIVGDHNIL